MRPATIAHLCLPTAAFLLFLVGAPTHAGERIAFESATAVRSIWIVDVNTGVDQQLTDDTTNDYDPEWSPDRQYIAFSSARAGTRSIWLVDVTTLALTRVTDDGGEDHNPTWSPDGTQIAFRSDGRAAATVSIWKKDLSSLFDDQAAYARLTDDGGSDYGPAWSPDGATIAFYSQGTARDATAGDHVWAKDLGLPFDDATAYSRMTDDAGQTYSPYWSPDGSRIGFQLDRWSQWDVGSRNLSLPIDDVAAYERLTDSAGMDFSGPVWSPDLSRFAFASDTRLTGGVATSDIWIKTTATALDDPSGYTVLVQGHHPAWEPASTAPDIALTPSPPYDFPDTPVNGSSPLTLTIASTGAATLTVSDITSDNAVFTVSTTPAPPFDLLAQDPDLTQDVIVTFTPTVEGAQTANITITHNAAGSPTVVPVSGTGLAVSGAAVTAADAQGQIGGTTTVAIGVSDLTGLGVAAVELVLTYDATLLTPRNDGTNTTAAVTTPLVPVSWNMSQNVPTAGELRVALAGESIDPIAGSGTLVEVTFDISATATVGATSLLTLTTASLNEGGVSSTAAAGTFTVTQFMYGDVTGNGTVSPYDATWVLDCVATELVGGTSVFPVEDAAPPWSPVPLTPAEAREVADVDDDGLITANDAVAILQYVVGLVVELPLPAVPPAPTARALTAAAFDVVQTSARPGARITVSLDASAMSDVRAGELVLDYDAAVLRPVDVSLRRDGAADTAQRPLLTHRAGGGRLAVAFASTRPIGESDATLEVTFEATRNVSRPIESAIRASHLRLNRSLIETGFVHTFRVEPFQTRLMANYPNPFNPETWIPFELAEAADVTIRVYGVDGRLVRTLELGRRDVGEYAGRDEAAYWDGANASGEAVASGVYIYELTAGDYHAVRRMVVRK